MSRFRAGAAPARTPVPRAVRALQVVTAIVVVAYVASTTFRRSGTSSTFFDVWVANLGYACCTALVVWRAIARRQGRWGWGALAAGFFLFTAGSVLWTAVVQNFNPVPYPSISDFCFFGFFVMAFLGIGLLVRETVPKTSRTVWVDGLIAALGVAAIEAVVVIGPIAHANSGDFATVATTIAYPIGDLVLLTMVVVVFAVRGWRPSRLWWTLGSGLLIFAAADTVYVFRVTSGTYVTGTPLDSMWLVGALVMAYAAWQGMGASFKDRRMAQSPIVVPMLFALSSLGIIVFATAHAVLPLGVVLAAATLVVAMVRAIYAFRQLRSLADVRREARTDELTGMPNRRMFFENLAACIEPGGEPRRFAVLMIDLDRFKDINDSLGHHVGDDVLRELGPRLIRVVGSMGSVARIGGDEFGVLLMPLDHLADATRMAERIRDVLREPFLLENISLRVDASIGIAVAPDHDTTTVGVLQKADVAMFAAKRARDPWQIYSSEHDQNARERFELMEDLRDAIQKGEIVPFFQPIVNLASGLVTSAEALARWRHPTSGRARACQVSRTGGGQRPPRSLHHDHPRPGVQAAGRVEAAGIPPHRVREHLRCEPARRRTAGEGRVAHFAATSPACIDHVGDHRGLLHDRPGPGNGDPAAPEGPWDPDLDRRLRHRVLVAHVHSRAARE